MSSTCVDVVHQGDENGSGMIVKWTLRSGRDVIGFATKNVYGGAWDVGPTWNYLITGDSLVLVDAGRRGMGKSLLQMMENAHVAPSDLHCVVLSHGHEDHDGGLYELQEQVRVRAYAHRAYCLLNRLDAAQAPTTDKAEMPAVCWHCPMPAWFAEKFCPPYHHERLRLKVTPFEQGREAFDNGIRFLHVPGHSPDAAALVVDDEAILVGDTILPDITPHPTRERTFELTKGMLDGQYTEASQLYGLRAYLRSLRVLKDMTGRLNHAIALPGHRLFSKGRLNQLDLAQRIKELLAHHIQRCSDILDIVKSQPLTAEDIARQHFEPKLLEGLGMTMAVNEVLSHCELLTITGDLESENEGHFFATGSRHFDSYVREFL